VLPNRLVVRAYVVRGFLLWFLTRLIISALLLAMGDNPLGVSPVATLYIVALTTIACFIETRRRHELALLGNLGVSRGYMIALFTVPAIAGEMLIGLSAAALR
jgi:hypothetical protein